MNKPDVTEELASGNVSAPARGSVDSYAFWVVAIMGLMACLITCVLFGKELSAIAFAIAIHAAAYVQQKEADRD